jgi:hypothetical protein
MSLRITGCALFHPPPSELIVTVSVSISSPVNDIHSVQVIVHRAPFAFQMSPGLSPFATWPALPAADYYGDSVTMGLAPVRPSRVPSVLNVSSMT